MLRGCVREWIWNWYKSSGSGRWLPSPMPAAPVRWRPGRRLNRNFRRHVVGFAGGRFVLEREMPDLLAFEPGLIALEGPHPVFGAYFHGGDNLEKISGANEILDRHCRQQDFAFGHADF